jgi:tetratricopeptide (TPR) repeat protein
LKTPFGIVCALCVLVLLVYSNSFQAGFALDNKGLILDDSRVHAVTAENLGRIAQHTYWWPVGESGLYRPFTTLTYLFNYAVLGNGEDPAGYHWLNFLLQLGNVLLVWVLARRLVGPGWPAAWVAALWATHPVLTESVTNIAGRADLLAAMAVLAGLWIHIRSRETTGRERLGWLVGLLLITTVGVFSKESAVTVLGVVVLYEATCGEKRGRREALIRSTVVVAAPIALMLFMRWRVLSSSAPTVFPFTDNPIVGADFWTGRMTAVRVLGRYVGLLLWPARLSCDYSYGQIPLVTGTGLWLAALMTIAALTSAVLLWRSSRTGFFVAGSALLVLLPVANLLFPIGTIMAERFLYLPSIAFAAAVVWATWTVARNRHWEKAAPVVLCTAILALGMRTLARNQDWRDELTLSTAAVQVSPASFKTHKMRANALLESDASHSNLNRVIDEANQSLAILDPLPADRDNADMYRRTGGYYFMQGDRLRIHREDGTYTGTPASVAAYRKALDLFERSASIQAASGQQVQSAGYDADLKGQIAKLYLRLDEPQKAMEAAVEARALNPESADAYRIIAGLLVNAGRNEEAVVALTEGVLITHDDGLTQRLVGLYQTGLDPQGCAIGAGGALNPSCATVRRHLCAASSEAVKLRTETNRPDLAEAMKHVAAHDYGCESAIR